MRCGRCINWHCMNCTDIFHLYVSCMYLLLFRQLVLYWKASGSKPTPLTGSNCIKRDLWNSSLSPSLVDSLVPHSLGPCPLQCWHGTCCVCHCSYSLPRKSYQVWHTSVRVVHSCWSYNTHFHPFWFFCVALGQETPSHISATGTYTRFF